jgi:RNA polymerase sigma factor for flagellar operon FliA
MAEIAAELGVTESRISQLRAEALVLLRGALAAALEPHLAEHPADGAGIVARRRATYAASVAARHAARRGSPAAERSA